MVKSKAAKQREDELKEKLLKLGYFKTPEGKQLYELDLDRLEQIYEKETRRRGLLMSNIKPVSNCTKCESPGSVVMHNGRFVTLECNECTHEWQTLSGICHGRNKPNGYATKGLCRSCYQDRPHLIKN